MSDLRIGMPLTMDDLIKTNQALYAKLKETEDELAHARDRLAKIRELAALVRSTFCSGPSRIKASRPK